MKSQKKDSESAAKSFLAKLRKELGIATPWKMARCLGLPFTTYWAAELRGTIPSPRIVKLLKDKFGWEKIGPAIERELEKS